MKSSKQIFIDSAKVVKSFWKQLLVITLVPVALNMFIQTFVAPSIYLAGNSFFDKLGESKWVLIIVGIIGLIFMLLQVVVSTAIGFMAKIAIPVSLEKQSKGELIVFQDLAKVSYKKLGSYALVVGLFYLVLLTGMLAFIVPGIIFSFWFMFSMFANILDNKKGYQALLFSKNLVKGRFWNVLGKLLFPLLILFLTLFVFGIFFFATYLLFNKVAILGVLFGIVFAVLAAIIFIALTLIMTVYQYKLYVELKTSIALPDLSVSQDNLVAGVGLNTEAEIKVPKWLKFSAWFSGIILLLLPLVFIGFIASNPQKTQEMIETFKEVRAMREYKENAGLGISLPGIFVGGSVTFEYPYSEGWKNVGQGEDEASIGNFVIESSKAKTSTDQEYYGAVIDVQEFIQNNEDYGGEKIYASDTSAYEFTDLAFSEVMADMQGEGKIDGYSLSKEKIGEYEIGRIEYTELAEDNIKVYGTWIVLKEHRSVYIFFAQATEQYQDTVKGALNKMIGTFKFTKPPVGKFSSKSTE